MFTTYNTMNSTRKFSRWDDWEGHRNHLSYILIDRVINKSNCIQNAIIFGAGNCDDIDLNYWLDNLSELYLVDLDLNSVERAIERQNITELNKTKIKLLDIDVSGLININFTEQLELRLSNKTPVKKIISYIRKTANDLKMIDDLSDFYGAFSIVVSSAIHTQLVTPYFIKAINNYGDYLNSKEKNKLITESKYLVSNVIKNYNQILINLTEKAGALFVWLDAAEISAEKGNFDLLPKVEKALRNNDREFLFSNIVYNFALTGACEFMEDLNNRFPSFSKDLENYKNHCLFWLWPFDYFKYYFMLCYVIRV